jgi:tetratricopeptide (TPR) repeat protein
MGRREESVALAKRVAAADPLSSTANFNLGIRQYQAGHFDDAMMTLERTLDLNPGLHMGPAAMAKVLVEKGDPQRALDVILSEPSEVWRLAVLPIVYHALGREDDAERVLSELIEGYSEIAAFQVAEAYAVLGGEDEAFRWLEIAYEQRDPAMTDLISLPTLASLRQDPRFDSLRERMGLPEPSE